MKGRIAKISASAAMALWPGWVWAAEGGEQAEGSWFALIFYIINFLLFLWIVRRYGWPRITQFFRDRSHTIRDIRDRAEQAYRQAQELATQAAQQLRRLEAAKTKMKSELDGETTHQIGQIKIATQDVAVRIRRDTEVTALALRDGSQRRLRETMAEMAGKIAREFVRRNLQESDQERLLRDFVEQIGEEAPP